MELSRRSCVKRDGGNFPQLCEACRHPSPLIEVMPELRFLTRSYHCYSSQDGFVCSWFLGSAPPNISCIPRLLRMEAHFTDSPISIHDELGAWIHLAPCHYCLHFMKSALTTQWDSHYHASEQETISANLGIYGHGYIMAKYLRNMGLKCYLGGLFPTFLAFSVNRCYFPIPYVPSNS